MLELEHSREHSKQTQTVSGLQVALLIVGNFTIKCHAVLEYGGEGEGSASSKCCGWGSNAVAGAGSFITYLDILPERLTRLDIIIHLKPDILYLIVRSFVRCRCRHSLFSRAVFRNEWSLD